MFCARRWHIKTALDMCIQALGSWCFLGRFAAVRREPLRSSGASGSNNGVGILPEVKPDSAVACYLHRAQYDMPLTCSTAELLRFTCALPVCPESPNACMLCADLVQLVQESMSESRLISAIRDNDFLVAESLVNLGCDVNGVCKHVSCG